MKRILYTGYLIPALLGLLLSGLFPIVTLPLYAQTTAQAATPAGTGSIRGSVADPSGAVIPNATVTATSASGQTFTATSDSGGGYVLRGLPPGIYTIKTTAAGFSLNVTQNVAVTTGAPKHLDISLVIEVAQQNVQVTVDNPTVSTDASANANSVVLKDKDLDQLSDDPDELSAELTALAGPSAGPNGGQIYIDGFTAGQLPPKSAIREIRVNQNPFSAEYDKLGYGRIEILTKPGTDKLHGQFFVQGTAKQFNSQNPFAQTIPDYHTVQYDGNLSSSLGKKASFFFNFDRRNIQDNSIVSATLNGPSTTCDPSSQDYTTYDPVVCSLAVPNPRTRTNFSPRLDVQLGAKNTLTFRYQYDHDNDTNSGVGQLNLPTTAYNSHETENTFQISDSQVLSDKVVNETRFQYIYDPSAQTPVSNDPTVQVQGAFSTGGSSSQAVRDITNRYEIQNYTSVALKTHFVKFGVRLRSNHDSNTDTANTNGYYTFGQSTDPSTGAALSALQVYQITENLLSKGLTGAQIGALGYGPRQFTLTAPNVQNGNAIARTVFDAGLFFQDDWKIKPNFTLSYGLRYETQNEISDHTNFAPRVGLAYGFSHGGKPAKTVLRAGYGFFYDRFQIAQVVQAGRQNGVNQTQFVVTEPDFYPNVPAAGSPDLQGANATPTVYRIDPRLKAPYTGQVAIGVDQQLTKSATISVTYLGSRGVHSLDTRNINAPLYGGNTDNSGLRPLGNTVGNIYQYESGGIFKQNQLLVNFNVRAGTALSLFGFYALGSVHSDTGGVTTFPSEQYDISADYGRASFDVRQRLFFGGSYQTPRWGIRLSPFMLAFSGPPFNITTSQDLNGDSIFNDRPSYAPAGQTGPNIVKTKYGNFNTTPNPGDPRIPINMGNAPGQFNFNLRVSKTIGIGPKLERGATSGGMPGGGPGGGRGGPGFIGFGGRGGGPPGPGGSSNRKYNLTLNVQARNLFNNVNYAAPIGVLGPTFGQYTGLGGAFGGVSQSANRRIDLQAVFSF